jgi:hypothetical protein
MAVARVCYFTVVVMMSLALGSCDGVQQESKAWRKRVEQSVNDLNAQMDKVALAVPGERYLRLLEAVRSKDPTEQARARDQVRRLFGVDFEQPYQVSIWWEKPVSSSLRLNYFLSHVAGEAAVRAQCDVAWSPLDATRTVTPPADLEELRTIVGKQTRAAIETLGIQRVIEAPKRDRRSLTEEEAIWEAVEAPKLAREQSERRQKAADQLRDAILAAFSESKGQLMAAKKTLPFNLLDGRTLLYVLVEEADLEGLTDNNFRVSALLHAQGDSSAVYEDRWDVSVTKANFYGNHRAIPCGNPRKSVRWAILNLTQGPTVTAQALASLKELEQLFAEFDKKPQ